MKFGQSFGHLRLELLCDVGRKDDLARSGLALMLMALVSKSKGFKGGSRDRYSC